MEIFVEHFDKVMDGFQVAKIVVVDVDAYAKVETRIATIDNFEVTELKWNGKRNRIKINCLMLIGNVIFTNVKVKYLLLLTLLIYRIADSM